MATSALHRKRKIKRVFSNVLVYVLLLIIAIICAGPFIWFLSTSFKTGQNIYDMNLFYKNPTLDNYTGVINFINIPRYFINTLLITVFAIAIDVVFSSLCAYPLAMMDFPGKKVIMGALIGSMIIPAAAGLVIKYLCCTTFQW